MVGALRTNSGVAELLMSNMYASIDDCTLCPSIFICAISFSLNACPNTAMNFWGGLLTSGWNTRRFSGRFMISGFLNMDITWRAGGSGMFYRVGLLKYCVVGSCALLMLRYSTDIADCICTA